MVVCKRCQKEWSLEEAGLLCPSCRTPATPDKAELAALFSRAVALEQDKKDKEAYALYALLCRAGSLDGEEALARLTERGIGTQKDLVRAADAYLEAAEHGSVRSAYRLGRLLLSHPRLSEGRGNAALWLRVASALGNVDASFCLAESRDRLSLPADVRFAYLQLSARAGHRKAASRLFSAYLFGRGVPRSPESAAWALRLLPHRALRAAVLRLFFKNPLPEEPVAESPHTAESLLALGNEAMAAGLPTTALRLHLLAADEGSLSAALSVGTAYAEGIGTPRDREAAIAFYSRAAEGGSQEAALLLGRIYEKECGLLSEAEKYYKMAAEHGTAEHQYILGDFYIAHEREGEGVRRAVPWLRRAAAGGCTAAADRLSGIDSYLGDVFQRAVEAQKAGNVREAFVLYERAAALGHAQSLSNMGYCLQKGIGCAVSPRLAVKAYREAVAAGSEAARLNLAACYLSGTGTGRDFAACRRLLAEAREPYLENAARLLAAMDEVRGKKQARRLYSAAAAAYHRGDVEEALRLRLLAAERGSARASYMIGCHFEFGDGVPLDREKAAAWYEAAAEAGFEGGHSRLKSGYLRAHRRLASLS